MTETFLPVGSDIDLSNCEREPIHIPGSVQPHGVLLTTTGPDDVVLQVSANCADVFGVSPEHVLGAPLADLFHPSSARVLARAMADPGAFLRPMFAGAADRFAGQPAMTFELLAM